MLRFVIWSLTLMNFMKSATSLVPNPAIKLIIKCLRIYIYIGVGFYVSFGITLVLMQELLSEDILSCKSREFIVQSSFLILILIVFHYYAAQVTREINHLVRSQDMTDLSSSCEDSAVNLNSSRKAAMSNVWVQLIWITVVAIENFLYSLFGFYLSGEHCSYE